jgi:hypothetical protein
LEKGYTVRVMRRSPRLGTTNVEWSQAHMLTGACISRLSALIIYCGQTAYRDQIVNEGKVDRIMDTAITVIQVVLTLIFTGGGLTKLTLPYTRFTKLPFQAWANDFKPQHIRLIGVLEACAAVGMIVPLFLNSLTMLMPLAAVGMALVMSGAMATHLRRSEYLNMVGNVTWLGLALLLAYGKLVGFAV